ncbi:unnamed protein product [Sphagnum tenellum]
MSSRGPQFLYKIQLSTFDLLKMVGLFNPKTESAITRACNLSLASYDVESFASPVETFHSGKRGCGARRGTSFRCQASKEVYSIHRPALIGLYDELLRQQGQDPIIYTLDEKKRNSLVAAFLEGLFERRDACVSVKYGILSSLLSYVERFKAQHFKFYAQHGYISESFVSQQFPAASDDEDEDEDEDEFEAKMYEDLMHKVSTTLEEELDCEANKGEITAKRLKEMREQKRQTEILLAWEYSVFGLLERNLKSLANSYFCMAFNSENFDAVILCSALVTYAKESGRRDVRIQRDGNKIKSIRIDGLMIMEAKNLMGPGISLAGLAKLCGLEESKAIFPFAQFKSMAYLDSPSLPTDAKDWYSELNPDKSPSQEEVNAAVAFFERSRFDSILGYISFYLSVDVKILLKAVVATCDSYYLDLGIHCVLKNGFVGGLCGVSRTASGRDVDMEPFVKLLQEQTEWAIANGQKPPDLRGMDPEQYLRACNAHHPSVQDPLPADYILPLDVRSQYAAAAKYGLLYGCGLLYNAKSTTTTSTPDDERGPSCSKKKKKEEAEEVMLERVSREEEVRCNQMDSGESLFVQYMALETFADANYVCSAFHSGCGQLSYGSNYRRKADLMISRVKTDRDSGLSVFHLSFWNYHEQAFHGDGGHLKSCRRYDPTSPPPRLFGGGRPRDDEDVLKEAYARSMTEVDPERLLVTYRAVHECEFFHGKTSPDPHKFNPSLDTTDCSQYKDVREMLSKKHPRDSVLGFRSREFTQDQLVKKIMDGGYNHEGSNEYGGFVTIVGGVEKPKPGDKVLDGAFGFFHQRGKVNVQDLGPFTRFQAVKMHGGDVKAAAKFLKRQTSEDQTFSRSAFLSDSETLSLDYFRFLVRERGLCQFSIRHALIYRHKPFLTKLLQDLLQKRHELRDDPDASFRRTILKLQINSFYGFSAIQASNFSKTKIVSERHLLKNKDSLRSMYAEDSFQVTLLGAMIKEGGPPDLLYAISSHQPKAEIKNTIQTAVQIVQNSRVVFMGKVLTILRTFDPRKAELTYTGSGSLLGPVMMATTKTGGAGGRRRRRRRGGAVDADKDYDDDKTTVPDKDEKMLEDHYFKHARKGIVLSVTDLKTFCKKSLIRCSGKQLANLRYKWKYIAIHKKFKKPSHYMSASIEKLGTLQIDVAMYQPRLRVANGQCQYFLAACDSLTGMLACIPCVNKSRRIWESGVTEMITNHFRYSANILTDRDGAIVSEKFRQKIKDQFGVSWTFLRSRSKAFKVIYFFLKATCIENDSLSLFPQIERMIHFLKQRITMALDLNAKGDNNWVKHVKGIVDDYNGRVIPGTTFIRKNVEKKDFMPLLGQIFRSREDPTMLLNLASSTSSGYPDWMSKKLWRFELNQPVLLSLDANYMLRKSSFSKKSITGSFGKKIYKITERVLKSNRLFVTPTYRLSGLESLYYETELIPAYVTE